MFCFDNVKNILLFTRVLLKQMTEMKSAI